jgi:murein DD-endopeptidase MepM/ murein hydrolase activator NlpD
MYPLFYSCHTVPGGHYKDPLRPDHLGHDFTPNDLSNPPQVASSDDGKVIYAQEGAGVGGTREWIVIVQHVDYWSCYGHLKPGSLKVRAGQNIKRYQLIATMGHSGYTVPPGVGGTHCHIQMGYGTYHGSIENNPTFDPLIKLGENTMLDELAVRRAVEGAYAEFLPEQHPSEEIIDAHVQACRIAGGFGQFFQDIHAAMSDGEKARRWDGAKKDYFS